MEEGVEGQGDHQGQQEEEEVIRLDSSDSTGSGVGLSHSNEDNANKTTVMGAVGEQVPMPKRNEEEEIDGEEDQGNDSFKENDEINHDGHGQEEDGDGRNLSEVVELEVSAEGMELQASSASVSVGHEQEDVDINEGNGNGSEITVPTSSTSPPPLRSAVPMVRKLDKETSSTIRKAQIITKISDVVRELVENSVDSGATSVKVSLDNFGLNKIEVRDTGSGISAEDVGHSVEGGYTSKMGKSDHLSMKDHYGFRGEALSSICGVAKVTITTRTKEDENSARKYVLNNKAEVVLETTTAYGVGTLILVENIFENFPVRRKWVQDKGKPAQEVKDVEIFLKGVAMANPKTHISLTHNGSMVWNKPAVGNMEQAISTVLGYPVAKNLKKCGPVNIIVDEEGDNENEEIWKIEGFFLKKPVDMRKMSLTSNKMMFFFVNRKRVFIKEFEKLLQLYNFAALEKPAPADKRRFVMAVVNIEVPSNEVDFNLDMDKSKVFLAHQDAILGKFEELLQTFFEIPELNEALAAKDDVSSSRGSQSLNQSKTSLSMDDSEFFDSPLSTKKKGSKDYEDNRNDNISSFLSGLPTSSPNSFSKSPSKAMVESESMPVSISVASVGEVEQRQNNIPNDPMIEEQERPQKRNKPISRNDPETIGNFDINIDELLMDTPPDELLPLDSNPVPNRVDEQQRVPSQSTITSNVIPIPNPTIQYSNSLGTNPGEERVVHIRSWSRGRIPYSDSNDVPIENVIITGPSTLPRTTNEGNQSSNDIHSRSASTTSSAFSFIKSGFEPAVVPAEPKRPRIQDQGQGKRSRHSSSSSSSNGSSHHLSNFNPSSKTKQTTVDQFINHSFNGSTSTSGLSSSTSTLASKPSSLVRKVSDLEFPMTTESSSHWGTDDVSDAYGLSSSCSYNQQPCSSSSGRSVLQNNPNSCNTTHGGETSFTILGRMSDPNFYTVKVNHWLGIFNPWNMLQQFPSLKYKMNISIKKNPACSSGKLGSSFQVSEDCVPPLLMEFARICENGKGIDRYPKIFHRMVTLPDLNRELLNP